MLSIVQLSRFFCFRLSHATAILEYHIEKDLYHTQGKAINNFSTTLPEPQSELANELIKDPYHFDFLQLSDKALERDIENGLVQHISQFLLEMGQGFAYMGRQYLLRVGKKEYRLDLLFYHTTVSYTHLTLPTT